MLIEAQRTWSVAIEILIDQIWIDIALALDSLLAALVAAAHRLLPGWTFYLLIQS